MVAPHLFDDHGFRNDPPVVAHEIFQQGELTRLQLDLHAATNHLAAEQVNRQIAGNQSGQFRFVGQRRINACIRASSSAKENGLVR